MSKFILEAGLQFFGLGPNAEFALIDHIFGAKDESAA
jgi:hypothetical protein